MTNDRPAPTSADPEQGMTFKEVMSVGGRRTLGVLFGLALIDSVDTEVFTVFAPEIRDSLGIDETVITVVATLGGVMVSLAALPLGVLGDRRRRTTIAGVCMLVWTAAAGLLGLAQNLWHLVVARILAGVGKANEGPVQNSILTDAYPPAGRGRVFGVHRSSLPLGSLVGPLLAIAVAAAVPDGHEAWRWAFAFLALPGLLLGVAALRLREPVRGRFERESPPVAPVSLSTAYARLRKIRTFSSVMVALGAFGLCVITVPVNLSFILKDQFGLDVGARGVIGAIGSLGALLGAAVGGAYSDRLFRRSPATCLYLTSGALAALGIGFAFLAYAPNITTFVVVGALTQGVLFAGLVPLSLIVASVTPPEFRATAFALVGLYLAFVGGLGGALVIALARALWGTQFAIALVAPTASVVAGVILARAAAHLPGDIARVHSGGSGSRLAES